MTILSLTMTRFQHTAARRRLGIDGDVVKISTGVSTHSRPKAAGKSIPVGQT